MPAASLQAAPNSTAPSLSISRPLAAQVATVSGCSEALQALGANGDFDLVLAVSSLDVGETSGVRNSEAFCRPEA